MLTTISFFNSLFYFSKYIFAFSIFIIFLSSFSRKEIIFEIGIFFKENFLKSKYNYSKAFYNSSFIVEEFPLFSSSSKSMKYMLVFSFYAFFFHGVFITFILCCHHCFCFFFFFVFRTWGLLWLRSYSLNLLKLDIPHEFFVMRSNFHLHFLPLHH